MTHDKQCEAMLLPPDMNRAQLCRCRLRELVAERKQMLAVIEAAKVMHAEYDQDLYTTATNKAFKAALDALEGDK